MKKVFHIYADPSHAWLKVSFDDLRALNLRRWQFSQYSYVNNNSMFLEEDCDAGLFVKAYNEVNGKSPHMRFHHSNKRSKIRGYASN